MVKPSAYFLSLALACVQANVDKQKSAEDYLTKAINALGGLSNLANIKDVSYYGAEIYRSRSIAESFALTGVDNAVSSVGRQNVFFTYNNGLVRQRIDKVHQLGSYWTWARPWLNNIEYSMVVEDGDEGYAAVVNGSYSLFAPGAQATGAVDGLFAAYLINEANKLSPLLLYKIYNNNNYILKIENLTSGAQRNAVFDKSLNISVILSESTNLPQIIRSYENHAFYGRSTRDYLLQNYTNVAGVNFPRRVKSVYNDDRVIEDFSIKQVLVNTKPTISYNESHSSELTVPRHDSSYDFSEIGEMSATHTWGGPYRGTLANLTAINPYPDLPGVWLLIFKDAETYRQIVYEFRDFVVVLDSPPHQSHLVIQWVEDTLKKPIKYVWPSHHHHDHASGVHDYVKAGAKVLTLDFAREYYSTIPSNKFVTYTTEKPFVVSDRGMQAVFARLKHSIHAQDYSYSMAYPACATENSTSIIFDADDCNPTTGLNPNDQTLLIAALGDYARDQVPINSIYVSGHGERTAFKGLVEAAGYIYPKYTIVDYKHRTQDCPKRR